MDLEERKQLADVLARRFSSSERRVLLKSLDVDIEQVKLHAENALEEAWAIVDWFERQQDGARLQAAVRKVRPAAFGPVATADVAGGAGRAIWIGIVVAGVGAAVAIALGRCSVPDAGSRQLVVVARPDLAVEMQVLAGFVRDARLRLMAGASVAVPELGPGAVATTDANGYFRMSVRGPRDKQVVLIAVKPGNGRVEQYVAVGDENCNVAMEGVQ